MKQHVPTDHIKSQKKRFISPDGIISFCYRSTLLIQYLSVLIKTEVTIRNHNLVFKFTELTVHHVLNCKLNPLAGILSLSSPAT